MVSRISTINRMTVRSCELISDCCACLGWISTTRWTLSLVPPQMMTGSGFFQAERPSHQPSIPRSHSEQANSPPCFCMAHGFPEHSSSKKQTDKPGSKYNGIGIGNMKLTYIYFYIFIYTHILLLIHTHSHTMYFGEIYLCISTLIEINREFESYFAHLFKDNF